MLRFTLRRAITGQEFQLNTSDIDVIMNERHGNPTLLMHSGAAFKADRPISDLFGGFSNDKKARAVLDEVAVLHPDCGGLDRRSASSFLRGLPPI